MFVRDLQFQDIFYALGLTRHWLRNSMGACCPANRIQKLLRDEQTRFDILVSLVSIPDLAKSRIERPLAAICGFPLPVLPFSTWVCCMDCTYRAVYNVKISNKKPRRCFFLTLWAIKLNLLTIKKQRATGVLNAVCVDFWASLSPTWAIRALFREPHPNKWCISISEHPTPHWILLRKISNFRNRRDCFLANIFIAREKFLRPKTFCPPLHGYQSPLSRPHPPQWG